jgi:cytochrome P450
MLCLADAASVAEYQQFCRGHLPDPYPLFHRLQAEDPVHWSDVLSAWVITRYQDVVAGLRDPRLSSERIPVFMGSLPEPLRREVSPLGQHLSRWVSQVNPPDHTRLRRLISIAFTPKTVEKVRPRVEELVHGLIDRVEQDGHMDLIEQLAYPLPATVISEMLGVPSEDQDQFRRWSDDIMAFVGVSILELSPIARKCYQSLCELTEYFEGVIQQCRSVPRDDLISALVAAEEQGDRLTAEELVAMCSQLLVAGHETTTQLIANGILTLLRHPGELQKLREDPSLITSAIEEVMRFEGPSQRQTRLVVEDMEIGGKRIPKGATVLLMLGAANRDPAEFPNPDQFDIRRNPNPHVGFSSGIHYCVGAPLARLEGAVAINALLSRLPNLRLATQDLQWRENMSLRGLKALPVTF